MSARYFVALVLLATGCSSNAPPEVPLRAMGQSIVPDEAPSDESIGAEVRRRVDALGPGEMAGIVIEVNDGVVRLRGVAPSQAAAWRAQSAAQSVSGVKLVQNQVIVNNRGPLP